MTYTEMTREQHIASYRASRTLETTLIKALRTHGFKTRNNLIVRANDDMRVGVLYQQAGLNVGFGIGEANTTTERPRFILHNADDVAAFVELVTTADATTNQRIIDGLLYV